MSDLDLPIPAEAAEADPARPPVDIAQRLRSLRQARGWTLAQAAERTGLALSTLSKIERRELSPTLASLGRLAGGFGLDTVTLLAGNAPPPVLGRRSINRRQKGVPLNNATCRNIWLATELRHKRMLPIVTRVTARIPDEYAEWQTHRGEVFVYVLRGVLVVHSELYVPERLEVGDSIYYDAGTGTKWTSEGEEDAKVLWVYA